MPPVKRAEKAAHGEREKDIEPYVMGHRPRQIQVTEPRFGTWTGGQARDHLARCLDP